MSGLTLIAGTTSGEATATSTGNHIAVYEQALYSTEITRFSTYSTASSGAIKWNLYDASGSRIWYSDTGVSITGTGWNHFDFSTGIVAEAGTYYYIGCCQSTSGNIVRGSSSGVASYKYKTGFTYATFTAPSSIASGYSSATYRMSVAGYGYPWTSVVTINGVNQKNIKYFVFGTDKKNVSSINARAV